MYIYTYVHVYIYIYRLAGMVGKAVGAEDLPAPAPAMRASGPRLTVEKNVNSRVCFFSCCLKRVSKSVQVLSNGMQAMRILTFKILK